MQQLVYLLVLERAFLELLLSSKQFEQVKAKKVYSKIFAEETVQLTLYL